MKSVKVIGILVILFGLLPAAINAQSECKFKAAFSERLLRSRAIKTVMPEFTEEAANRKAKGQVIAQVVVDEEGNLSSVEVTASPDASINQAVIDALKQWKFQKHAVQGRPLCITGQLTFKYSVEKGKGKLKDSPQKQS